MVEIKSVTLFKYLLFGLIVLIILSSLKPKQAKPHPPEEKEYVPEYCLYRLTMPYGIHFSGYILNCSEKTNECIGYATVSSHGLYPMAFDTTIKKLPDLSLCKCHFNVVGDDCRNVYLKSSNENSGSATGKLSVGDMLMAMSDDCFCRLELIDTK